jgi:hypothetical protein
VSRVDTVLAHFGVPDADNETVLDTQVVHHLDTCTGYELITITQVNEDGSTDVVCLTRADLAALATQVKGH